MKLTGETFVRGTRWITVSLLVLPLACTGEIGGAVAGAGTGFARLAGSGRRPGIGTRCRVLDGVVHVAFARTLTAPPSDAP